jgi:hypothetical protein
MLTVPYISPQEFYDNYNVDLRLTNYVPSGTQPGDSLPLISLLRRASSLADQWCKQVLRSTVDTESCLMYPTKQGTLRLWPEYRPIISLTSLRYRPVRSSDWFVVSDLSEANGVYLYQNFFEYSGTLLNQFTKLAVEFSYINGFPVVEISGTVNQGSTTITVKQTPLGIQQGTVLTLYDGVNSEDVVVESVSGNVLTLASPTLFDHTLNGLTLSAMPQPVRDAVGMIAANMIQRGVDGHISEKDNEYEQQYKSDSLITPDIETLLQPYQVNR